MRRLPTTGNTPARAARLACACGCLGLSLLAALGGCNPATRTSTGDPLVGDMHPNPKFSPAQPLPPDPGGVPAGVVSAGAWQSRYAGMSYEQLQDQLSARKVTVQHQETIPGGWKFTCSVPNPFNPDFSRTYEATARDYRSAL